MSGYIVREDIPAFAVNKHTNEETDETRTFLNFKITELREPDRFGNTHTIFCQEYNAETKERGEKFYIGKCKPIRTSGTRDQDQTTPKTATPKGGSPQEDDLPF